MQTFVADGMGVDPAIRNRREIDTFAGVLVEHAGGVADQTEVGLGEDQTVLNIKSGGETLSGAEVVILLAGNALAGLVVVVAFGCLLVTWDADALGGVGVVVHFLCALQTLVLLESGDQTVVDGDTFAGAVVFAVVAFGSIAD